MKMLTAVVLFFSSYVALAQGPITSYTVIDYETKKIETLHKGDIQLSNYIGDNTISVNGFLIDGENNTVGLSFKLVAAKLGIEESEIAVGFKHLNIFVRKSNRYPDRIIVGFYGDCINYAFEFRIYSLPGLAAITSATTGHNINNEVEIVLIDKQTNSEKIIYTSLDRKSENLVDLLNREISFCASLSMNEESITTTEDYKNGYISIAVNTSPCGCTCLSTAAAFKDAENDYTLLKNVERNCEWSKSIKSNKPLEETLPENFNLSTFADTSGLPQVENAVFFLSCVIPRKGTEVAATLELLPLGIQRKSVSPITYDYSMQDGTTLYPDLPRLIEELSVESLHKLRKGRVNLLTNTENEALQDYLENGIHHFESVRNLVEVLTTLHHKYTYFSRLKYNYIILQWDRNKARFLIKDRIPSAANINFKTFLVESEYYDLRC